MTRKSGPLPFVISCALTFTLTLTSLCRDSPGSIALVEAPSSLFQTVPHLVVGNHRLVYYSTYTPTEELAALLVDRCCLYSVQ